MAANVQNRHFVNYISAWATRDPGAPSPRSSMSGVILFRRPYWIIIYMLPWKMLEWTLHFRHFPKWPPFAAIFSHKSVTEAHIVIRLLSLPMFPGSMNPLRATKLTLGYFAAVAILKFKMAAKKNQFSSYPMGQRHFKGTPPSTILWPNSFGELYDPWTQNQGVIVNIFCHTYSKWLPKNKMAVKYMDIWN